MLKKGKRMGYSRKRKSTATEAVPNWKMEMESSEDKKDSKITFYFQQVDTQCTSTGTYTADHNYSKKIYTYDLPDIKISSGNNMTLAVSNASKKKLNKKGTLTSCNAQNTKVVQNGVRHGECVDKPTSLPQVKKEPKETRKHLTDYFPVRRSVRKTSVAIKKEKQKEIEDRIVSGREDSYEVRDFMGKGRGVVSIHPVKRGDFVLEYSGDLISVEEAKRREYMYAHDENIGCYMYYFTYKNRQYCVDATRETGRLGRLVNHSKKGNLKTRSVLVQDIPRLILVAERDIFPGEELLYDYGDRSKRSLESHPWLAL